MSDYTELPFSIIYADQSYTDLQWSARTQLFFTLSGFAQIFIDGRIFNVQSEDVFLINANDAFKISGSYWKGAVLSFRPNKLAPAASESGSAARFDLCSAENTYNTVYDFVRYCMAQLITLKSRKEQFFSALSIFYALYSHLTTNFSAPPVQRTDSSRLFRERLTSITDYISEHYMESLTLSETAQNFGLSGPYLSAFFKKHTGKSFMEYYNDIRLSHAVIDLLSGSESIETISINNGFRDPRTFTYLFKKRYHVLPSTFRRDLAHTDIAHTESGIIEPKRNLNSDTHQNETSRIDFMEFPSLAKYLTVFREDADFSMVLSENPRIIDAGTISLISSGIHLTHNYHNMICVGSARQFLYSEIQEMLRKAQKEIHFKYVKFHGLLSDEMMVYSEDKNARPAYSFTFIDKILDFLLSIELRPLVQLSFMPMALAQDPSRLVDFYHYNTSPPKDMKKWADLVSAVVQHIVKRYGLEEVKKWPFCVWNEPDETVDHFAWDDRYLFFDFYKITWQAVKNICPEFRFGTPSMLISVQKEEGWAGDFFKYTVENRCLPDFINIHYYDNSLFEEDMPERVRGKKGYTAENMERSFPLTADPYAFMKFINNVQSLMQRHNMKTIPIYLTEWNLTISHRDLINDTCFKSCHLIKNLLENYDRLESYSYWCLTDFEEELQVPEELYHGGLGLFTYNGIPKANYNAFRLLGHLGDELINRGDGYFVTRADNRIVILLYNYEHYSKLFASGYRSELNDTNRYTAFGEMSTAQFTLRLTDIPCNSVLIKERFVNQFAGSSYDAWARMGSHPLEDADNLDILMQQSQPGIFLHIEPVDNGVLTLHTRMAPLEIRLLEIVPQ